MTSTPETVLPWRVRHLYRRGLGPGAPADLRSDEIGINETDTGGVTVWLGIGDDGAGHSTSQIPIAGPGAIAALLTAFVKSLPTAAPSAAGWWSNGGVPTYYDGS